MVTTKKIFSAGKEFTGRGVWDAEERNTKKTVTTGHNYKWSDWSLTVCHC